VASAPLVTRRFHFTGFVILYAFAALAWLIVRRAETSRRKAIVIAIALRALFLFAEPQLSGDVWRYMWDGRTLASGHDPYASLPDDPRVNHRDIPTIYPPHAELVFAIAHNLVAWRLLLIAADVVVIFLLRQGRLAYATLPPLLFEGAWSGHIEVFAAMLLFVAARKSSGSAAAAAVGMKVIPIAAVPVLFLRASRMRFAIAFLIVLLLPFIPFALAGPVMPGMRDYATRWIFNSPMYSLVALFCGNYTTRAVLGVCAIAAIAFATKRRSIAGAIGALLICSPTIHPWYWLALAPFASGIWLALTLCAPFSYLLYEGASPLLVFALCYGIPFAISLSRGRGRGWPKAG
jgi:alpha-1,6-mannosyltransferase